MEGAQIVSPITTAPANPATGPRAITTPKGSARRMRGVSSAPTIMPRPYVASVAPTAAAESPRCWIA